MKTMKFITRGDNQIIFALIVLTVILSVVNSNFLTLANLINILKQVSIIGIISMGMTVVIIAGGIDLSVGSVLAVVSIVTAMTAKGEFLSGLLGESASGFASIALPAVLGIASGLALGAVNGLVVSLGRIPPFIATLGMMSIARGLAQVLSNGIPIAGLNKAFLWLGGGVVLGIPFLVISFAVIVAVMWFVLQKLPFGRYAFAIGGNVRAAYAAGVKVRHYTFYYYALTGLLVGIAGVLLTSRIYSGAPNVGLAYELDVIAACVIGGVSFSGGIGTIRGTILGLLLVGVLNNGLDLMGIASYYQNIIKGIIIIAAVMMDRQRE